MNAQLTRPPRTNAPPRVILIACSCPEPSTPSLGVTSIATYLLDRGKEVQIFDDSPYMIDIMDDSTDPRAKIGAVIPTDDSQLYRLPHASRFDDLLHLVRDFQPTVLGVSATEPTFRNAVAYLERIKKEYPEVVTVLGGPFGILAPEMALRNSAVDLAALGEGEATLDALCDIATSGRPIEEVPGIAYRGPGGTVVRTSFAPLIDISALPPLRYDLYPERRLYRPISGAVRKMLPLEISRGCPYGCAFCASPEYRRAFRGSGRWHRVKGMEALDADLRHYLGRYNPEYFFFISETFLGMPKRDFEAFLGVYGKYRTPFWMNTRPETINEESISALRAVGLERMSVGVECGNERYRTEVLNRRYSNDMLRKVFDILHRHDIKVTANVMIGMPGETPEMIQESLDLVREIAPTSVGIAIFQPYKGTRLYQMAVEQKLCDPEQIIDTTCYTPNLANPDLSDRQLLDFLTLFNAPQAAKAKE